MSQANAIVIIAGASLGLGPAGSAAAQPGEDRAHQAELVRAAGAATDTRDSLSPTLFGEIQVRYTATSRKDATDRMGVPDNDITHGFTNQRTKIGALGGNEQWRYRVNGGFGRDGGGFVLADAFVDYVVNDQWEVRAGQFKLPIFYEESMASGSQLAADRSYANEIYNQDRSQGVMVTWDDGRNLRAQVAVSDGINTDNTDFNSSMEADYGISARIDRRDGDWAELNDFTSELDGRQAIRFGAFAFYQDGGATGGFGFDNQLLIVGADAQWERDGWSAFASLAWVHLEAEFGDRTDDYAIVLQGARRFAPADEVFARASTVLADSRTTGGGGDRELEEQVELLAGYNHYFDGHSTKLTVDAAVFLEPTNETLTPSDTALGLLPATGDPQVVLRAQLQILY